MHLIEIAEQNFPLQMH